VYYGTIRYHGEFLRRKAYADHHERTVRPGPGGHGPRNQSEVGQAEALLYRGMFIAASAGGSSRRNRRKVTTISAAPMGSEVLAAVIRREERSRSNHRCPRLVACRLNGPMDDRGGEAEEPGKWKPCNASVQAVKDEVRSDRAAPRRLMTAYVESVLSLPEYKAAKNKSWIGSRFLTGTLTTISKNQS